MAKKKAAAKNDKGFEESLWDSANGVSPVGLTISVDLLVIEESDEGNIHVRVCGGSAG